MSSDDIARSIKESFTVGKESSLREDVLSRTVWGAPPASPAGRKGAAQPDRGGDIDPSGIVGRTERS